MSPYTEGYFGYNAGLYPDECPYWWGTWEYEEWFKGYYDAAEDN